MSIEKLKEELRKFVEFDEKAATKFAIEFCDEFRGSEERCSVPVSDILVGARWQHAKSARYAEQLLECVEVLEFYANKSNWYTIAFRNDYPMISHTDVGGPGGLHGGNKARELLAKLSKGDGA